MALTRPFPIDQAYPNAADVRKQSAAIYPREGVFPDPVTANPAAAAAGVAGIAYGNGGWNVGANPFVANVKRGGVPYSQAYGSAQISNDAAGTAWTITSAPASGTRVDRLWIRAVDPGQGEATSGTDGPGGVARAVPVYGKTDGTPGIQPLPAGAVEIAQVSTPSTATSIAQSVITQTYAFANVVGTPVYFRLKTDMDAALALFPDGSTAWVVEYLTLYTRVSGAWVPVSGRKQRQNGIASHSGTAGSNNGSIWWGAVESVVFPVPFLTIPRVILGGGPDNGQVLAGATAMNVTVTGFDYRPLRVSGALSAGTLFTWMAEVAS